MGRVRSHLTYANVMVSLLAFVVLTGGVAYAANTIFSSDIVDGEVKTPDIGNNQIRSVDVRDDTLAAGGLGGADLAPDSVGASEVAADGVGASELGLGLFESAGTGLGDSIGGGPSETMLIDRAAQAGFQIIGRCNDAGAGGVTSQVLIKTTPGTTYTMSVDSDGPSGATDQTGIPGETFATLASFGPTTGDHWGGGDYAVSMFFTGSETNAIQFTGNVAVAANVGPDCRFQVTAVA